MSDDTKVCECSFPKFVVDDGIQSCIYCGLNDHYKNGVVADWSDDEEECCVKCCVKEPAGKLDMWLICECVGNYCGSCSPTNNCSNYPICSCPCGMCAVDVDDE